MKKVYFLFAIVCVLSSAIFCQSDFDVQGHRGCRGVLPENSIPGFIEALKWSNTLELDVVISKDHKVVISHEPFMNHEICLDTSGISFSKEVEENYNLYEMTADEIAGYDCGSTELTRFPIQKKMPVYKPLLSELFDTILAMQQFDSVEFNIEIKRRPSWDNKMHPDLKTYCDLVVGLIDQYKLMDRVHIQSFNIEVLQYIHEVKPGVRLVFLVQSLRGMKYNLRKLGFTPEVYSPFFKLLNKRQMKTAHRKGIRVIPWTVNSSNDIQKMLDLGVDGIISDYPKRVRELLVP